MTTKKNKNNSSTLPVDETTNEDTEYVVSKDALVNSNWGLTGTKSDVFNSSQKGSIPSYDKYNYNYITGPSTINVDPKIYQTYFKSMYPDVVDQEDISKYSNVLGESETRKLLRLGVNILCDTVKLTLGTKGRLVLYSAYRDFEDIEGSPVITKDGVSVANQISSTDNTVNLAMQIIKQAAQNTVKSSGDGTTSTCILSQALVNGSFSILENSNKKSSWELSKQIDEVVSYALQYIKFNTIPVDDDLEKIRIVANISSNSEEIGTLIHDIIKEIGFDSEIEVKKSHFSNTSIDLVKGMKLYKGFFAPFFCTDQIKMTWEQSKVKVLIYDDVIRDYLDIAPYIKAAVDDDYPDKAVPLLIYAQDVSATTLNRIENMMKHNPRPIMIVEHDGWGDRRVELLNDLSIMTNAMIIDSNTSLSNPKKVLGYCDECIVTSSSVAILGGDVDEKAKEQEIDLIRRKLESGSLTPNESHFYKKRLSNLHGGVAVINVGGNTRVEMKEKYDRIEDAVLAVRSALADGISIGGGYTWERCITFLEKKAISLRYTRENNSGFFLVIDSLKSILNQLLVNSGNYDRQEEIRKNMSNEDDPKVFNLIDNELYSIPDFKVYDATSVLVDSLYNAASVAKSVMSIQRTTVSRKLQGVILD